MAEAPHEELRIAKFTTIAAIVFCLGVLPLAADDGQSREFLTLLGVKPQADLYPQLIVPYVQHDPNMAIPLRDDDTRAELAEAINDAIFEFDYFAYIVDRFERIYDEKRISRYAEFVRSDIGRRIVRMELEAGSPEASMLAFSYSAELDNNPPPENRLDLARRILSVTGGREQAAGAIRNISRGIYAGLRQASKSSVHIVPPELGHEPEKPLPLGEAMITAVLFAYREATIEDLEAYVSVLETEETRWVLEALATIHRDMVGEVSSRIGRVAASYFDRAAAAYVARFEKLDVSAYALDGRGYAVNFPGEPGTSANNIPTEFGDIVTSIYHTGYADIAVNFYAFRNVYPAGMVARQLPYQMLDNAVAGMIRQGRTLIAKKKVTLSGRPGYTVRIAALNGMMSMRGTAVLVGNTIIQVFFSGPAYIADHPSVDRFLASLRIVE